jgi:hypothetical protein
MTERFTPKGLPIIPTLAIITYNTPIRNNTSLKRKCCRQLICLKSSQVTAIIAASQASSPKTVRRQKNWDVPPLLIHDLYHRFPGVITVLWDFPQVDPLIPTCRS